MNEFSKDNLTAFIIKETLPTVDDFYLCAARCKTIDESTKETCGLQCTKKDGYGDDGHMCMQGHTW